MGQKSTAHAAFAAGSITRRHRTAAGWCGTGQSGSGTRRAAGSAAKVTCGGPATPTAAGGPAVFRGCGLVATGMDEGWARRGGVGEGAAH